MIEGLSGAQPTLKLENANIRQRSTSNCSEENKAISGASGPSDCTEAGPLVPAGRLTALKQVHALLLQSRSNESNES
jgi:hypothetical protein